MTVGTKQRRPKAYQEYCIRRVDNSHVISKPERQTMVQCIKAGIEKRVYENGVRGLMLDMYDFENDIWLCQLLSWKMLQLHNICVALKTWF
nr:hypothetical protein [Tanacetum cinerariifolium]